MSVDEKATGTDLEQQVPRPPIPLYNGVMSPDRWTLFGRIAHTVFDTDFVPKGVRGNAAAVMACLLYGDSLGLHPSVALKEVYIVDGKPGISGALMIAKIRADGHRVSFKTIRDEAGAFVAATCVGKRIGPDGEVVEEDEWTFSLDDAKTAGLLPTTSDKAAWKKYPETMCRWRALSQLARFLFADVFAGGAIYTPDEVEEAVYSERVMRNGAVAASAAEAGDEADFGDDPQLAAWLLALFAKANEVEAGKWLPKRVKLALKGKTQDERATLAIEIAEWITEAGHEPPLKPPENDEAEAVDDADVEVVQDAEAA